MTRRRACNDASKGVEGACNDALKGLNDMEGRVMNIHRVGKRGVVSHPKTDDERGLSVISLDAKKNYLSFLL